jgi:hypothetical protein
LGEELLIVCVAKIATGDPWIRLIPGYFGGEVRRCSFGFRWFHNHLLIISIIKFLVAQLKCGCLVDHLAHPAHSIKVEYYQDFDEQGPACGSCDRQR